MCQMKFGPHSPSPSPREKSGAALQNQTIYLPHRPHLPSSSPKEKRRCCISLMIFISTTSALVLYSSFSKFLLYRILRKARAVFGWPSPLEKVGMRLPDQCCRSFLKNFFTSITMRIIQEPNINSGTLFKAFYFTVPFFQPVSG